MWTKIESTKYEANAFGQVRRIGKQKTLSPCVTKNGYLTVTLSGAQYYVHRIIATMFVPNPDNKPQVNHKDGNKKNNAADNLKWTTCKENIEHAYQTGLSKVGENRHLTKLKNADIAAIRQMLLEKKTQKAIAATYGVTQQCIGAIAKGKTWAHL